MTNDKRRALYISKGGDYSVTKRNININVNGMEYLICMRDANITAIVVKDEESNKWIKLDTVSIKNVFGVKKSDFIKQLDNMDIYSNYMADELLHEGLEDEFMEYVDESIYVVEADVIADPSAYVEQYKEQLKKELIAKVLGEGLHIGQKRCPESGVWI